MCDKDGERVNICVTVHMTGRRQRGRKMGRERESLCVQPSVKIWQRTIRLIHSYLVTVTLQPIK